MIEESILKHSKRGMDILKQYLKPNYCEIAAEKLLRLERGVVFLTTGFFVAGFAETDGPVGTVFLAIALKKLGFSPVIVTDSHCMGFFEEPGIAVRYMAMDAEMAAYQELIDKYRPCAIISVERCGINKYGDFANMRGSSIASETARTDLLFELAAAQNIYTIGVGDGGNEIGMGNLAEVIEEKLSLVPCMVKADDLIIATVSNWGAYGLTAYLERIAGGSILRQTKKTEKGSLHSSNEGRSNISLLPDYEQVEAYLKRIVRLGSVDGVNREHSLSVDGFSLETEREILEDLREEIYSGNLTYKLREAI